MPSISQRLADASTQQASGSSVVTLQWHPHEVFPVPIRQGMFTTFQFPAGEKIQEFVISAPDSVDLHVDAAAGVAMLKLKTPVASVATVVTNARVYYLRIEPALGAWDQGVSWDVPSADALGGGNFAGGIFTAPAAAPTVVATSPATAGAGAQDTSQAALYGTPNFGYHVAKVTAGAPFTPVAVWDNGRFTWIQFRKDLQELPAVFAVTPNGLEIVNYTVHNDGTQLLVNRLMPKFVLKLGKAEVTVVAGSGAQ
jgi:type IV secretion system protein VirB9